MQFLGRSSSTISGEPIPPSGEDLARWSSQEEEHAHTIRKRARAWGVRRTKLYERQPINDNPIQAGRPHCPMHGSAWFDFGKPEKVGIAGPKPCFLAARACRMCCSSKSRAPVHAHVLPLPFACAVQNRGCSWGWLSLGALVFLLLFPRPPARPHAAKLRCISIRCVVARIQQSRTRPTLVLYSKFGQRVAINDLLAPDHDVDLFACLRRAAPTRRPERIGGARPLCRRTTEHRLQGKTRSNLRLSVGWNIRSNIH